MKLGQFFFLFFSSFRTSQHRRSSKRRRGAIKRRKAYTVCEVRSQAIKTLLATFPVTNRNNDQDPTGKEVGYFSVTFRFCVGGQWGAGIRGGGGAVTLPIWSVSGRYVVGKRVVT